MATTFDAKPGESCSNDHWSDRFTCPNCYTDHTLRADEPTFINCDDCGARLHCEVETIESAVCTIVDPDEEDGE